jgi:uncharacterized lipoprotein YmbA
MTHTILRCIAVISCFSAIGCSVLAPVPDRSRFFSLTAMSTMSGSGDREAAGAPAAAAPAVTYGLGPINLPPYLDRHELATRVSPTEVTYSTTDRWAEPLSATFAAVLLQDLSALLDTNRILAYPWAGSDRVDYQIEVSVLQFDNDVSGNTRLVAHWRVRDVHNAAYVVAKETTVNQSRPAKESDARVRALSDALDVLGQDIAAELRQLPAPGKSPASASRRM